MNPKQLITATRHLAILFALLLMMGCNNKSGDGKNKVKELFSKELEQTNTDSLFIRSYISKVPAFNENADLMYLFYGDRDYKLAWFKENKLVPQTEKFLSAIDKANQEGLDPKRYKVIDIEGMIKRYEGMSSSDSARLQLQQEIDVALTASYFHYASDFYRGRINPKNVEQVDWNVKNNKIKLHKALQTILQERESTYPYYEFEALHAGYTNLRSALQKYRAIQQKGGWPKVELGKLKSLKKGDSSEVVITLRKRLNPEQPINVQDPKMRMYDAALEQQVKKFQQLHGLKQDGIVGGNTLKTMNISIDDRIEQIIINMERWRWIPKRMVPKSLDQKYIWVNIPEYMLYIYEDPDGNPDAERKYKQVMSMRVVVGKEMSSTPIFSDKLESVVMAPYWNVPNSIVENEIKSHMLTNPYWLDTQDMEIVTKEKEPKPIDPLSIDWASVTEKNFPYMVRQRPGPKNSLGSLKFLFPNEYAIYLHDTPADGLFNQNQRGFSHGCVRLEKPVELAKYLLRDMPEWNESRIRETIDSNQETWVTLPKKVQVYLVYFTSWVDDNGDVHFREDIYGHDKKLKQEYFS